MGDGRGKKSIIWKIAVAVIVLLLIVVIALPFLLDVNQFRPQIEARLSTALGRQVTLGEMRLSLLSGSLSIADIAIADAAQFSASPFITAGSLAVGVEMKPLIFSRKINITGITLNQPAIYLRSRGGKWNFADLGAGKSGGAGQEPASETSSPSSAASAAAVLVAQVEVVDGRVEISEDDKKPQVYEKVNLDVSNLSLATASPFTLTATLPGAGTLALEGNFGPLRQADITQTPLDAQLKVARLNLVASGFAPANSTLGGVFDFTGNLTSDGVTARSKGKATATALQLVKDAAASPKPMALDYNLAYNLKKKAGNLTNAKVGFGAAVLGLTGNFDLSGAVPRLNLKLQGNAVPIDELQSLLPTFGIVLPKGSLLTGGSVDAEITAEGPLDNLIMNGGASINETRLTGFNLAEKLALVAKIAGLESTPDTLIEKLGANMRWTPQGIDVSHLQLLMPVLGQLSGTGTISPQQELDFAMQAVLKSNNEDIVKLTNGRELAVSFFVRGPATSPKFVPDYQNAARGLLDAVLSGKTSPTNGAAGSSDTRKKESLQDKLKGIFTRN